MDPHNHDEEEQQHKGHRGNHWREAEGMARRKEDERRHGVESGSFGREMSSNRRGGAEESGGDSRHDEDYSREVGDHHHDDGSNHLQEGSHDGPVVGSENGSGRCEELRFVPGD